MNGPENSFSKNKLKVQVTIYRPLCPHANYAGCAAYTINYTYFVIKYR
jgi:hypothetical protein